MALSVSSIYQIYKEEWVPTLHKLCQETQEDGAILNSFPVSRAIQQTSPAKAPLSKRSTGYRYLWLCIATTFTGYWQTKHGNTYGVGYVSGRQIGFTSKNQSTEHHINKGQILHQHFNKGRKICF